MGALLYNDGKLWGVDLSGPVGAFKNALGLGPATPVGPSTPASPAAAVTGPPAPGSVPSTPSSLF